MKIVLILNYTIHSTYNIFLRIGVYFPTHNLLIGLPSVFIFKFHQLIFLSLETLWVQLS